MNRISILLFACAIIASFSACKNAETHEHHDEQETHQSHNHNEHKHETHEHRQEDGHNHNHEHKSNDIARQDISHSDEIIIEPAIAERFGIETEKVAPQPFSNVIRATGRVLQSNTESAVIVAPVSGMVKLYSTITLGKEVNAGTTVAQIDTKKVAGGDTNAAAKAALDAAKDELDRLTPLYQDRLITASEYNSAKSAYNQALATYSAPAISGHATSPISGVITSIDVANGQYVEVGTTLATIGSAKNLTLRIDVPQKYYSQLKEINNANIILPYSENVTDIKSIGGYRIANATIPAVGSSSSFVPVYFNITNDGTIIPGATFDAYLLGEQRNDVISLPVDAISEQQGNYYVYRKIDNEGYTKQQVKLGESDGKRIVIESGIQIGDVIVSKGTTTVRLAEMSSVIPEGHSHNH